MAKYNKRVEARTLRRKGLSTGVISEKLGVSKSSVSIWCSDITLPKFLQQRLIDNRNRGRLMGAMANKRRKQENIKIQMERARDKIKLLSSRDLLIAGISLYWAEGAKTETTSGFSFMNSDPKMILFVKNFLNKVMGVQNCDITATIQINSMHKARIDKVLKFWSTLLKLPFSQFNRPYYVNTISKKVYENHDTYYGTLRLKVKRSSNLKYYIKSLIEELCRCSSGS